MKQNEYISVFQIYCCKLHTQHRHEITSIWNDSSLQTVDMADLKTPTHTQNYVTTLIVIKSLFFKSHCPKSSTKWLSIYHTPSILDCLTLETKGTIFLQNQ